ncbi:MAG: hypothetical protein HUU50_22590 [Candidatus Brocadiae bacterium]|nr:hypothetical protein [Candidatus Brocadiia bacterium]
MKLRFLIIIFILFFSGILAYQTYSIVNKLYSSLKVNINGKFALENIKSFVKKIEYDMKNQNKQIYPIIVDKYHNDYNYDDINRIPTKAGYSYQYYINHDQKKIVYTTFPTSLSNGLYILFITEKNKAFYASIRDLKNDKNLIKRDYTGYVHFKILWSEDGEKRILYPCLDWKEIKNTDLIWQNYSTISFIIDISCFLGILFFIIFINKIRLDKYRKNIKGITIIID